MLEIWRQFCGILPDLQNAGLQIVQACNYDSGAVGWTLLFGPLSQEAQELILMLFIFGPQRLKRPCSKQLIDLPQLKARIAKENRPSMGGSQICLFQTWLFQNFALLLRSFALFADLRLRSFALLSVRPRLEGPSLGLQIQTHSWW